jgi:hypothetical protein
MKNYRFNRFVIGILGLLTLPAIIILAYSNPLLKDYPLFWICASTHIIILSLFMTENFTS